MPNEETRLEAALRALMNRFERGYTGAVAPDEAFTADIIAEFEAAARADAEAQVEKFRVFAQWVANNAMAEDPVWVARDVLGDYMFVDTAPKWYRDRAAAAAENGDDDA